MTRSRPVAAAALLGAAAVVALPASPAQAAGCAPGTGVTVVVEPGPLGGGSSVGCAGGAGGTATDATKEAGFSIDYVASQPGFVCRLNGKPSSDPCQRTPPQDAYWGLFWSDGKGSWKYSTAGASSLKVPEGGSIGWRFQDGGATDYPVAAPNGGSTPEPEPDPQPVPDPAPAPDPGTEQAAGSS